jgi:hypothetical protein
MGALGGGLSASPARSPSIVSAAVRRATGRGRDDDSLQFTHRGEEFRLFDCLLAQTHASSPDTPSFAQSNEQQQ